MDRNTVVPLDIREVKAHLETEVERLVAKWADAGEWNCVVRVPIPAVRTLLTYLESTGL